MSAYAKNYGYFFNSNSGDRTYNAESFEEWLKPFFLSGVFQGELQVKAQTTPDMTVKVTAGHANLDGKAATWDSENTMQLSVASGVYDRIDTIVLRRDNVNRTISIEVVTGTASADPQPTAPTRTANIFELVLAQILVGTGVTAITQANITDTRMDSTICGYVAATVDQIDFDQIYAQYEAWQADTQDYFTDWFEAIRGQLDEDAAGHLQNEIDDLSADVLTKSAQTLTNSQFNQVYKNLETVSAYDLTAFVEHGATAANIIPKGRYVMWYGNPAIPHHCLCWSTKDILEGDTLSAAGPDKNLDAITQNSLNALQGYIDDLNGNIATLISWRAVANVSVASTNAWTDMNALSESIKDDELYYVCLLVGDKMTSNNFILSGVDLKGLTTTNPAYLVSYIDESNAKQIYIAYNSISNKLQYYCGSSVFPNKTKIIYVMRVLKRTA